MERWLIINYEKKMRNIYNQTENTNDNNNIPSSTNISKICFTE